MDNEANTPTQVRIIKKIPFFADVGEIATVPEYEAKRFIECGTAEAIAPTPGPPGTPATPEHPEE